MNYLCTTGNSIILTPQRECVIQSQNVSQSCLNQPIWPQASSSNSVRHFETDLHALFEMSTQYYCLCYVPIVESPMYSSNSGKFSNFKLAPSTGKSQF